MKIVINRLWTKFSLSREAVELYAKYAGREAYWYTVDSPGGYHTRCWKLGIGERHANEFCVSEDFGPECEAGVIPPGVDLYPPRMQRDDPILVRVVEELGPAASSKYSKADVIEIPDGVCWEICDDRYGEFVREKLREWRGR